VSELELNPHTPVPTACRVTTDEGDVQPSRREFGVPSYLIQLAYAPDVWAAMVKQPQNRLEAVRPVVGKLGRKFEHAWLAFGSMTSSAWSSCRRTPTPLRSRWPSRQGGCEDIQDHPVAERGRRSRSHAQGARDGVSPTRRLAAPSIGRSANRDTATIRTPCAPTGRTGLSAAALFSILLLALRAYSKMHSFQQLFLAGRMICARARISADSAVASGIFRVACKLPFGSRYHVLCRFLPG
jgi:hypothetical protein